MPSRDLLRDRLDIEQLHIRYFLAVDDSAFDEAWVRSVFTEDARLEFPVATHTGIDGIVEVHRTALDRFERTQHLASGCAVDLDGDQAQARVNVVMTHVHLTATRERRGDDTPFVVGGLFDSDLVRTADGWRFRRMTCHMIWHTGRPPEGVGAE